MELLGSLQHPYIYPVLDLGFLYANSTNYACLVMPFNLRGSLKDLIYKVRMHRLKLFVIARAIHFTAAKMLCANFFVPSRHSGMNLGIESTLGNQHVYRCHKCKDWAVKY